MDSTSIASAAAAAAARELRAQRGRKQITSAEIVEATGISKSAVLRYLNGQRDIPLSAFFAICAALDVSPALIIERAGGSARVWGGVVDAGGDVCPRCRHTLRDERCPSCGWAPEPVDPADLPPYAPDDGPGIRGW